jgi:hypothetical protein
VTDREIAYLIIGVAIGLIGCAVYALVQRAMARRAEQLRHKESLSQRRARQLRSKLEDITGRDDWELDVETIYSKLFSENGFRDEKYAEGPVEEQAEVKSES